MWLGNGWYCSGSYKQSLKHICLKSSTHLNVFMNSNKRFFERIKGGRVQHFLLDLSAERSRSVIYTLYNPGPANLSGHQDIRNSFCFLLDSVVPWHWCSYSKSYRPYLKSVKNVNQVKKTNMWQDWVKYWPAFNISTFLQVVQEILVLGIAPA